MIGFFLTIAQMQVDRAAKQKSAGDLKFPRWTEKLAVILCDYFALNAAFFWWAHLRSELGMFSLTQQPLTGFYISNIVFVFWFLFFLWPDP